MPTTVVETINRDLPIKGPEKSRHRGSRSDAERCEHLSIHPLAGRIWREGITKK
jgi:hypothetical protein